MTADLRVIRAVEAVIAVALILALYSLIGRGIVGTALGDFSGWWAERVQGLLQFEVTNIGDDAPGPGSTPDRIDVFATPPQVVVSSHGPVPSSAPVTPAAAPGN